ncbi:hypothetical protein HG536_0A09550 [Torulaspora globosa]|uniref:Pre-rRNA-processing protein ESF2 n=1 Tax=Torulaspora globosa TaxID=48254 RepID=A0A7G3ZCA2_9SACH|nr:uncharacterized protein HG536_0A09550 [Torulaspora globosa]QLL31138.1 hypothetical protein HG536_0A09550 [Torulaspora globosa]
MPLMIDQTQRNVPDPSTNCNMSSQDSDYADFSSEDEQDQNQLLISTKKTSILEKTIDERSDGEESASDEGDRDAQLDNQENSISDGEAQTPKQKKASTANLIKKLKADKKLKHKTGVVYLSSIPPYMKPAKMRQILSRFGEVDRLFLKREDEQKYKRRVRGGGNKKAMYEEGWAEFIRKRDAKLCAETLNGNIIGGRKGSFYHDDILNVKYLPGFKWTDLTEQIARENDIRQSKLEIEISQANKMNAEFAKNVEKSKMIENIKRSKRQSSNQEPQEDGKPQRSFKQHKVATSRANAPSEIKQKDSSKELSSVLSSLF